MNTLVVALMMQAASTSFMVSTKAGLVNYVQGAATVQAATAVKAGKLVQTGPNGRVEILLNPGSYLRMGADSQVVLEKVELYDMAVRVVQGSAIIEAKGFTKTLPLAVTAGDLKMQVIKDGVYMFAGGKVVVVEGQIRNADNGLVYGKGYLISDDQGYRAQKVKAFPTSLELWSQKRDAEIEVANINVAKSLSQTAGIPVNSFQDVWFWYEPFGSFIYLPGTSYRSPYGYSYQPVVYYGGPYRNGGSGAGGSGGGSNGNPSLRPINNRPGTANPGNNTPGTASPRPAPASPRPGTGSFGSGPTPISGAHGSAAPTSSAASSGGNSGGGRPATAASTSK
jgi:hypothetical protein